MSVALSYIESIKPVEVSSFAPETILTPQNSLKILKYYSPAAQRESSVLVGSAVHLGHGPIHRICFCALLEATHISS
jgi:hypothetical protein